MLKFSFARAGVLGVVSTAKAALYRPCQQNLSRCFTNSSGE